MSRLPEGDWMVESLVVNSKPMTNRQGFERVHVCEESISILPIGLDFVVEQYSPRQCSLSLQGHSYFANFVASHNELKIQLTRPNLPDQIEITARMERNSMLTEEREVIQV